MIIDIFLYNNEEDILDIHLNVHSEFVDKFVLLESPFTISNKPKELNYEKIKNENRFKKFKDKIEHIIIPSMMGNNAWENEHYSRNYGMNSDTIKNAELEDIIIYSDCDEIINPEISKQIKNKDGHFRLEQKIFYYYLNCQSVKVEYRGPSFLRKKLLTNIQEIRRPKIELDKWSPWGLEPIKNAGWHLSYMGGIDKIIEKMSSFAHSEFNTDYWKNPERISKSINKRLDLYDRGDGPMFNIINPKNIEIKYIRNNLEKFKHLIKE